MLLEENKALVHRFIEVFNAWCELSVRNLRERCPWIRVGLLTDPEGKEPALLDRRGHLPNCTLRHRGRLSPVPLSREVPTRPRDVSESQRGSYPGSLRSVGPLRQRAGLLPLRNEPSARRFPNPARSLAIQPLGAPEPRSDRVLSLAPANPPPGRPRRRSRRRVPLLLRSFGLFDYPRPRCQASRRRMVGLLRLHNGWS